MSDQVSNTKGNNMNRRDLLKGLATVPVLGAFAYGTWRKKKQDHIRGHKLAKELNMSSGSLEYTPFKHDGATIRIGLVGYDRWEMGLGLWGGWRVSGQGGIPRPTI